MYLYDVIFFSNTVEDHILHVRYVLTLLRDVVVSFNLKKCFFFHKIVYYLGHFISPGSSEVSSQATDAVQKLKAPRTVTELRSFLGVFNIFRRFFPNFARISAKINLKLRKSQPAKF